MLKWLRRPGKPEGQCDWNAETCVWAASGGNLEVLKWLRLPGKPEGLCPWVKSNCEGFGDYTTNAWVDTQPDDYYHDYDYDDSS